MKQCQLVMVTSENNNKFYNMVENGNVIDVTYGRVGCKETHCTYPISKWDSLKNSKIKKGYKEVTNYKTEVKKSVINEIKNDEVKDIVTILLNKARTSIAENYLVSYTDVTQKQIDEAQNVLNSVLEYRTKYVPVAELNNRLLNLYTIVPRKMKRVQENLLSTFDTTKLKEIIKNEQELLDTMATQVSQNVDSTDKNILEVAGLEMKPVTKTEEKIIKQKLGNNKSQYIRAFKVVNKKTQEAFDKCLQESQNKQTDLYWHGSRTENWWSILSTGLMIRPSGVATVGAMYGLGIYFAPKAQKSIGYTSLRNSYWVSGNDNKAYLALFEVNTGKPLDLYDHDHSCYDLNYAKVQKKGCDCTFAHAGKALKNDELIIYRPEQCTVKYLVEISS